MLLDIVKYDNKLLKDNYYHPYSFKKDQGIMLVEECLYRNHDIIMNSAPFFYIPEDDFYLNPIQNYYAFKHDKKYDVEVQGAYEGLIINGNEVEITLVKDYEEIEDFYATKYRDYTFKYVVVPFEEEDIEVNRRDVKCLFKVEMYKGEKLLHQVILRKEFYSCLYVEKINDSKITFKNDKRTIISSDDPLFIKEESYFEIDELVEIRIEDEINEKELWDGKKPTKVLKIYVSHNVKVLGPKIIWDFNHTDITIYYDGTIEEWRKIKKGEVEYSYSTEWVDYQHFKSIEHRSEEYANFINANEPVKIICKDGTIIDDKKLNQESLKEGEN